MDDLDRRIQFGRGLYFNSNGELQRTKCKIVYGPPASGKTTYVKSHRKNGDLVVDLDNLKQAISLEKKLEEPDNLLPVALYMRECIYDLIEKRKVDCETIWIVAGLPCREERLELMKRLDAELIFINTTYKECIARSENDAERKDKQKARKVIDKWFANYER